MYNSKTGIVSYSVLSIYLHMIQFLSNKYGGNDEFSFFCWFILAYLSYNNCKSSLQTRFISFLAELNSWYIFKSFLFIVIHSYYQYFLSQLGSYIVFPFLFCVLRGINNAYVICMDEIKYEKLIFFYIWSPNIFL